MNREDYAEVSPRVDDDAPPCSHCGAHTTHWTEYHGNYDCHCECCGRVYKSREQKIKEYENAN